MRLYVFMFLLLSGGYAFSQAVAEGALLNSSSSGATAKGGTALGAALNGSFSNTGSQVNGAAPRSPHMTRPTNAPKSAARTAVAPRTTAKSTTLTPAASGQSMQFTVYPPSAADPAPSADVKKPAPSSPSPEGLKPNPPQPAAKAPSR